MAINRFAAPALPIPDKEYSVGYFTQLVRTLTLYFNYIDSTSPVTFDSITLTNLPTSGYNLVNGAVYSDSGILKVVLADIAYAGGVSATVLLGDVTVTI